MTDTLVLLGIPLTRAVETGRDGGQRVFQQQRTGVFIVVDGFAYLGGLAGGMYGTFYLFQLMWGE